MQKKPMYGNQIEIDEPIKVSVESLPFTETFDCGNEVINDYLKMKAKDDTQTVAFMLMDKKNQSVIGYYALSCSGFIIDCKSHYTIYPAVEIKIFAIDEKYQHLPYSENIDDGTFSDNIFGFVISKIYDFTDNFCGADKIILYSVPKAVNFYKKNGFLEFEEFMLQSKSRFLDGCIPMYLSL